MGMGSPANGLPIVDPPSRVPAVEAGGVSAAALGVPMMHTGSSWAFVQVAACASALPCVDRLDDISPKARPPLGRTDPADQLSTWMLPGC